MKTLTTLLLLLIAATTVSAQDIIHKKDDDNIRAKVLEIGKTEIKYKKWKYQDGDTYTIPVYEVKCIDYPDGTRVTFKNESEVTKYDKVLVTEKTQESKPIVQENIESSVHQNNIVSERPVASSYTPANNSAQDKMYLHNGTVIDGSVLRVAESNIIFTYKGETAQQVIGKYAIDKIVYHGTNRVEKISDKVVVRGKDDWENVVVLEDKTAVMGLTKGDEVEGKSANSYSKADKKAIMRLKEEAAEMGYPFVLLTYIGNHTVTYYTSTTHALRKGVCYRY